MTLEQFYETYPQQTKKSMARTLCIAITRKKFPKLPSFY